MQKVFKKWFLFLFFYVGGWVSGWFVWMHLLLEKKVVWILVGMVEQCEKVLGCKFITMGVIMQKGILKKWIFMWGVEFLSDFSWNGLTVWKGFRLEIHNCGCDYAKSYMKKLKFLYWGLSFWVICVNALILGGKNCVDLVGMV